MSANGPFRRSPRRNILVAIGGRADVAGVHSLRSLAPQSPIDLRVKPHLIVGAAGYEKQLRLRERGLVVAIACYF